jgi:hypothetical protein
MTKRKTSPTYVCRKCGAEFTARRPSQKRIYCSPACRSSVAVVKHLMPGGFNRTHGESRTRLYQIWTDMKRRCYVERCRNFKWYGARGIVICDEWKGDFETFKTWAMQSGYASDLEIDREDTNGNYCPDNCRWVTELDTRRVKRYGAALSRVGA